MILSGQKPEQRTEFSAPLDILPAQLSVKGRVFYVIQNLMWSCKITLPFQEVAA